MDVNETRPYEILIRFDQNGALNGAHMISWRKVVQDGEVLSDGPGRAQPLAVEEGTGSLWDVLSAANVQALSENDAFRTKVADQKDQIDAAAAENATLRDGLTAAGAWATAVNERINQLAASLDMAIKEVASLQAQLSQQPAPAPDEEGAPE